MNLKSSLAAVVLLSLTAITSSSCNQANGDNGAAITPVSAPSRAKDLRSVTDEFGAAVVTPGQFAGGPDINTQTAWTSWYFPANDPFLARRDDGQLSPLEKYDRYVNKTRPGSDSQAANDFYTKRFNPSNTDAGDGLCNAWSAAALMEPEPKSPRCARGIQFDVIDLKALLVLSYETLQKKLYGQPFTDPSEDDYADIYPEQLHRLIQVTLLKDGTPFVIDRSANEEVWNTPVTAVTTVLVADENDPHVMHVTTRFWQTAPLLSDQDLTPTEVAAGQTLYGFVGQKAFWETYTYDLVGNPGPDGLHVVYGTWTGDSGRNHPDFATVMPTGPHAKDTRGSLDNIVDPKIVDEIVNGSHC